MAWYQVRVTDRHHYSVTTADSESSVEWFHLFEEANERFQAAVEGAAGDGLSVSDEAYWRRTLTGGGRTVRISLDDRGLRECGAFCGAG